MNKNSSKKKKKKKKRCLFLTLACVRFRAWNAPKSTIKVLALQDEFNSFGHVKNIEAPKERHAGEGTVREPGVHLTPLIAKERAIWLLQTPDDWSHGTQSVSSWSNKKRKKKQQWWLTVDDLVSLDGLQRVVHGQDLNGTECVQQMRVMSNIPTKATYGSAEASRAEESRQ